MATKIAPIAWVYTPDGRRAVIDHGPEQTVMTVDECGHIVVTTYLEPDSCRGVQSCVSGSAYASFGDVILRNKITDHLRTIKEAEQCPSE